MSEKNFDLFISYRRSQKVAVERLQKQLESQGLKVFRDASDIEIFDSITTTIQTDLSHSKALLLYLSDDYPASRFCQWELTAAFIAAQRQGHDPRERIFVINASDTTEAHETLPVELRDARFAFSLDEAISEIPKRLTILEKTFGQLAPHTFPSHYGRSLTGSPRFVGREKEMWQLHSDLQGHNHTMVTGHVGPDIAEVSGMGGIGKTLLAEEYALRFGAAYPGGIFWLDAYGSFTPDSPDITAFEAACFEQHRKIASSLLLPVDDKMDLHFIRARIAQTLQEKGQSCLWIVDDLPYGLADHLNTVKQWFSPHPDKVPTLITTRSREYNTIGSEIALDVLDKNAALQLFKEHDIPLENEKTAAEQLIKQLGSHALALDIACASIKKHHRTISDYLQELDEGTAQLLDIPREIVAALPTGCEKSIINSMLKSICKLNDAGLDFLRLAANLAPAPISEKFITRVFSETDTLDQSQVKTYCRQGLDHCEQLSLARNNNGLWSVHALVAATIHYYGEATGTRANQLRSGAEMILSQILRHDQDYEYVQSISLEIEYARHLTKTSNEKQDITLLRCLADFDYYRGNFLLSVQNLRRIERHCQQVLGPDHPDTLTSMNNLAFTLWSMGDHRGARELEEQALERRQQVLGPDHPDTLASMNNLASTLKAMGDHPGARELQEHVLERRQQILGSDHPSTTISAWNLHTSLHSIGDHQEAKNIIESHLIWLLDDGVELHDGNQITIRNRLKNIVSEKSETNDISDNI